MFKAAITFATLFCFSACTMLQPVPDVSAAALAANLKPGDTVKVSTAEIAALELKVTSIDAESLKGVTPDGQAHSVPVASIARLEKNVPDAQSTTWLALGIVAAGVIAVVASSGGGGSGGGGGGY